MNLIHMLLDKFYISIDEEKENEIIEDIQKGVSFRGFNLWVLVFAIFVASLGLNTNSTAVIIGAMLISPLMGPIVGMGLSMGINDIELLKKSFRNYAVATIVSVLTATLYFYVSPIRDAQSELLARTSPSMYDVLIAFFGGAAGIVAIFAREKGNVVPGVAIATALMPPLCTAGYGIATLQWDFFMGSFYLFFINTVFISLSTFIGVRSLHFSRKKIGDAKRAKMIRIYISLIAILTLAPSIWLTIGMVHESLYTNAAEAFVKNEMKFDNTSVVKRNIDFDNRHIDVVLVGSELSSDTIKALEESLSQIQYLKGSTLSVHQSAHFEEIDGYIQNMLREEINEQETVALEHAALVSQLQAQINNYKKYEELSEIVGKELSPLFPSIQSFSIAKTIRTYPADSVKTDTICMAIIKNEKALSTQEFKKLSEWLKIRLADNDLQIINY